MGDYARIEPPADHKPWRCITIWKCDRDDNSKPRVSTASECIIVRYTQSFLQLAQGIGIDCEMVAKASLRMNTQWLSRMRQACFAQVFPWAGRLWSTSYGKAVFGFTVCSFA